MFAAGAQALLSSEALAAAVSLCADERHGSDLPDPWSWADLTSNVDATVEVVQRRAAEGRTPVGAQVFRWPKDKGGWRPMAWLDPYDHITYRAAVGPLVPAITASLCEQSVLSARIAAGPPAWAFAPWGRTIRERRKVAGELLDQHPVLGVFDIKNFFPTIRRPALELVYGALPVESLALEAVLAWLDDLSATYKVRGLPTGPEASRVLANGLLAPCDNVFGDVGAPFLRYVDDTWFFVDHLRHFDRVRDAYEGQLAELGLALNEGKSKALTGAEARNEVEKLAIAYLGDTLDDTGDSGLDAALDLFGFAMESPRERKSELNMALKHLGNHHDPHPYEALKDDRDLLGIAPYRWVKYLKTLRDHGPTQHVVDDDWLVEGASAPLTQARAHQNLLLLRATEGRRRLSPHLGKEILKVATGNDAWSAPLRPWAVRVWSRSMAFKPAVAADQVLVRGDLSTRRAFALSLKVRPDHPSFGMWCEQVRRADRDLEPTVRWLEAA